MSIDTRQEIAVCVEPIDEVGARQDGPPVAEDSPGLPEPEEGTAYTISELYGPIERMTPEQRQQFMGALGASAVLLTRFAERPYHAAVLARTRRPQDVYKAFRAALGEVVEAP